MNQESRKFLTTDRHEFLHGNESGNQAPRNDGLGSRHSLSFSPFRKGRCGNNCRAGASPATFAFGNRSGCPTANCARCAEDTLWRRLQLGAKMKKRREQGTQATQSSLRLVLCSLPLCRAGFATPLNFVKTQGTALPRHPKTKEITNSTRNIKNRSFAMPADATAIPPNPKTAATSAMIRKTTAQLNISSPPQRVNRMCRLVRVPLHACSRSDIRSDFNDLPQLETSLSRERH